MIIDISGQGKYVFSDGDNEFLLRSEKKYAIGDELRLVGNVQEEQGTREKGQGNEYWNISKETFVVPLFS